jgi:hypothetical protein
MIFPSLIHTIVEVHFLLNGGNHSMQRPLVLLAAGFIVMASLSACTPARQPDSNTHRNTVDTTRESGMIGRNFRSAQAIADRITYTIPGVRAASVLIAGDTAYVAVDTGSAAATQHTNPTPINPANPHRVPAKAPTGAITTPHPNPNVGGVATPTPRPGAGPYTTLPNGTYSNVPYTGNRYASPLSVEELKNRVAAVVRQTDPSIREVRVTTNPDIYTRFYRYAEDLRAGRPVSGIFRQFEETVSRLWPTPH